MNEHENSIQVNPSTIPLLDINRYMGKWHEVAKLPIPYERGCDSATAEYKALKDGKIHILNTCYKMGRKLSESEGEAWLEKENYHDPGKLTVTFFENGMVAPYWIHWTDYDRFSVVGGPDGQFAWILSREKKVSTYEVDCLVTYLNMLGYETCNLIFSKRIDFQ